MTRKYIFVGLMAASMIATVALIVGSFVSYAQPISSADMQNFYISRILTFGIPAVVMQIAAVILVFSGKQGGVS
jgi:hypothetical protein